MIDIFRAWWWHQQGLDGSMAGASAAEVLARTGWARSVGGSGPYLGLFARAGLDREAVDADVAKVAVHELPSARGCTYILPAQDFATGLTVGSDAPELDITSAIKYLGVTREEIDHLGGAVCAALEAAGAPLSPAQLKAAVGEASRSLGDAGRKRGQSTTLPMALGLLQAQGAIRRVPVNGRLDNQKYTYTRWSPSPLESDQLSMDEARKDLARRYFSWAAPASIKHFRWFSGLSAANAKKAVHALPLSPIGEGDLLIMDEQREALEAFSVPVESSYSLVAGNDGIHLLHRDMGRLISDADAKRPVPAGAPGRTLGDESDPPAHLILDRGRIVGLWEYDSLAEEIVTQSFIQPDNALRAAIARTETFIRDQLGDARSFSLDSPASRAPRIAALRAS